EHRWTGFADGHQPMERTLTRTTMPQLTHKKTVRKHEQVNVPCLALDITQLTIPEAELLLAVPMEGLRTCPAIPIDPHDSTHFPGDPIRHQDFAGAVIVPVPPKNHDPNLVVHVRDFHGYREVPLPLVPDPHLLSITGRNQC